MNTKTVASYKNFSEAELACSALESNGISCDIANEHLNSMLPLGSVGDIQLKVSEKDFLQAEAILQDIHADSEESSEKEVYYQEVDSLIMRASYGAVAGLLLLPIISHIFSLFLLYKAYHIDRDIYFRNKKLLTLAYSFNVLGLLVYPVVIYQMFLS